MTLAAGEQVQTSASPDTGLVTFVSTPPGAAIPLAARAWDSPEIRAREFLDRFGGAFGLDGPERVAVTRVNGPDLVGMEHVRFQQVVDGVPVTAGELTVHLRGASVVAANGRTLPDLAQVVTTPEIWPELAEQAVRELLLKHRGLEELELSVPRLELFNRGLLEGRRGVTRLAWFIEARAPGVHQFVWVDAQEGFILLDFSQQPHARQREVYDAGDGPTLPGTHVRSEGDPPTGDSDADLAYDYAGDTYDYFLAEHGRDSYDAAGATLVSTVHYCPSGGPCPYPNAQWNRTLQQMIYGEGYPAGDDVVGHELTHAVTEHTAALFYYMQSGALDESYADVFGETVDLGNGAGNDTAAVRWLGAEDIPGVGPIRDMMDPTAFGHPGKLSDPEFDCGDPGPDGGGVHTNSGVPNHAYALMVDGGSYNGFVVTGIGLTKAGKIQYRTLAQYLHSGSGFQDNYDAIVQACADLVGTAGISVADCTEVQKALDAVEMADPWPCRPAGEVAPLLCPLGGTARELFHDDLEDPDSGLWTTGIESGTNHWLGAHGFYWFGFSPTGTNIFWGQNLTTTADSWVATSSDYALPPGEVRLQFVHSYGFENNEVHSDAPYDGGVIEYSLDGGATWVDAGGLIAAGAAYGEPISTGYSNPLGGRPAFVKDSFGYTRTQLDLSSLTGQAVRFRFRVGTDEMVGDAGWFIDEVRIYECQKLYDQTDSWGVRAINSQENEPSEAAFDTMAADDFVVPAAGAPWAVDGVMAAGRYKEDAETTPLLNLEILSDSASLPGAVVCSHTGLEAEVDFTDLDGNLNVRLPTTCSLAAGTYWLMVQADLDYFPSQQLWFWEERTAQTGEPFAWQNPGDGYGTGCVTWTPAGSCLPDQELDLVFTLWSDDISTPPCYPLTLGHTGSGADPLPSSPLGCPAGQYGVGTVVRLVAAPDAGWAVGGWSGTDADGSTSTVNTTTMPASAHAVSVAYVASPCYSLIPGHSGSGADPSPSPTSVPGCPAGKYHAGDAITLTAAPDPGWTVAGWSGTDDDASTSTTNTLTMPAADHPVSVTYVDTPCYGLTLGHGGAGDDPAPSPIASPGCSAGSFHAGDEVTLLAKPAAGHLVSGWAGTGDDASTFIANTLIMPAAPHAAAVTYAAAPSGFLGKLTASDATFNSLYGTGVAVAGDIVVVGAPNSGWGTAYVYERNHGGPGNWGEVKKLVQDGGGDKGFARQVAISGNTIAIGAPRGGLDESGKVYLFERNLGGAGNWGLSKVLQVHTGYTDEFGHYVAIDGDTLAVGSYKDGRRNEGAAWVFERDRGGPDNWGMVKKVVPSVQIPEIKGWFGYVVGLDGDVLAVFENHDLTIGGASGTGSVYVFERDSGGEDNWGEVARLIGPDHWSYDFGHALDVSGDTVAVGADGGCSVIPPSCEPGAVYLYERDQGGAGQWGLSRKLLGEYGSLLGTSVALFSDILVAGAPSADGPGSASVFVRNLGGADNWGEAETLLAFDGDNGDKFGGAVAVDSASVVVGAPMNGPEFEGAAYLFGLNVPQTCFPLSVAHTGSGADPTLSPPNSASCPAGSFYENAVVTLTAAPDAGWQVASWTGTDDDASTSTVNTVTMPGADHAASVAYVETPAVPDHLHIHDTSLDTPSVYEACLSITLGTNVEVSSAGIVLRSPDVMMVSPVSVLPGGGLAVHNSVPTACAAASD